MPILTSISYHFKGWTNKLRWHIIVAAYHDKIQQKFTLFWYHWYVLCETSTLLQSEMYSIIRWHAVRTSDYCEPKYSQMYISFSEQHLTSRFQYAIGLQAVISTKLYIVAWISSLTLCFHNYPVIICNCLKKKRKIYYFEIHILNFL